MIWFGERIGVRLRVLHHLLTIKTVICIFSSHSVNIGLLRYSLCDKVSYIYSCIFYAFDQFVCNIRTFNPHDTLLGAPVAQ